MRYVTIFELLLMLLPVSAFGDVIDPNVGFCNDPASKPTCGGDPNVINSTTSFGMISFGSNNAAKPWYFLLSVPEAVKGTATAPSLSGSGFTFTLDTTSNLNNAAGYLLKSPPTQTIYNLTGVKAITGLSDPNSANNSMSNVNMFPDAYFGSTPPADFAVFVYTVKPGFNGNTPYSFTTSRALVGGTYLAAIAVATDKHNNTIQFSTPFTTTGVINTPDGGMTLMLLGGALVGLETLRRRLHV